MVLPIYILYMATFFQSLLFHPSDHTSQLVFDWVAVLLKCCKVYMIDSFKMTDY